MNILAICGSLRPESSNMSILNAIPQWLPANVDYHIYNNIGKLSHFDPTLNHDNTPAEVDRLRGLIAAANGVIICSPEYAFGIPGSLKNALDWTVSSGEFINKSVAVITASSSGEKAHEALLTVMNVITGQVPPASALLIPYIRTKVVNGIITDEETTAKLQAVIASLLQHMAV
jgi:chromate reductase